MIGFLSSFGRSVRRKEEGLQKVQPLPQPAVDIAKAHSLKQLRSGPIYLSNNYQLYRN